jgi:hypothetical protein
MKDFNISLLTMNAFLHFIINNEIIHRFWDSAACRLGYMYGLCTSMELNPLPTALLGLKLGIHQE